MLEFHNAAKYSILNNLQWRNVDALVYTIRNITFIKMYIGSLQEQMLLLDQESRYSVCLFCIRYGRKKLDCYMHFLGKLKGRGGPISLTFNTY